MIEAQKELSNSFTHDIPSSNPARLVQYPVAPHRMVCVQKDQSACSKAGREQNPVCKFACPTCRARFSEWQACFAHMAGPARQAVASARKTFSKGSGLACQACGKKFVSANALLAHHNSKQDAVHNRYRNTRQPLTPTQLLASGAPSAAKHSASKTPNGNAAMVFEDAAGPEITLAAQIEEDGLGPLSCVSDDGSDAESEVGAEKNASLVGDLRDFFAQSASSASASQPRTTLYGGQDAIASAPRNVELALLGHLNSVGDPQDKPVQLFLNVTDPFCAITVGVQGSGKSHTSACILENCLLPLQPILCVKKPMSILVCHYDQSDVNCCEATGLGQPSAKMAALLAAHGSLRAPSLGNNQLLVLCSPSFYHQRRKYYAGVCEVRPLLFKWSRLKAQQLKVLMRLDESSTQLYVAVMLDMLRGFQRKEKVPAFEDFIREFEKLCSSQQAGPLKQRFQLLSSFIYESSVNQELRDVGVDLSDVMEAGRMVVVDLSDPMMSPADANSVFHVLLETFRFKQLANAGKLVAFGVCTCMCGGGMCKGGCVGRCERVCIRVRMLSLYVSARETRVWSRVLVRVHARVCVQSRKCARTRTQSDDMGVCVCVYMHVCVCVRSRACVRVHIDEAHRYMGLNGESDALAREITDCARLMRHEGMRLLISTQSPKAMPEELLELTSLLIVHRFQSSDWHAYLAKKVPLPDGSFELIRGLAPGEALVYSARPAIDDAVAVMHCPETWSREVMRVQVRSRLTADRGASRVNLHKNKHGGKKKPLEELNLAGLNPTVVEGRV